MKKEDNQFIKRNMVLNVLKTFLLIIFPLITYPYITRVLQVENFGKVSYANSIVGYIALIAALGISSYAIREGGIYRASKKKMEGFASQIFTINIYTTILSYVLLALLLIIGIKEIDIKLLLIIQSASVICTTIGVDWMNIIYEDYVYITVRSFLVQIISLALMFLFVKTTGDYLIYSIITVSGNLLIALSNWVHIRKYCKIRLVKNCHLGTHILPIMVLFSNTLAVSIYLNSDNIMIGIMIGEYSVGLYAVSVKIYTLLKQIVGAIYNVAITRMSEYAHKKDIASFKSLFNILLNNIVFIAIPLTVGLVCTAKTLVYFICGPNYSGAVCSLQILAIAILFAVLGGMIAYCINLPLKKEKYNLFATSISAITNILLNFLFIQKYGINGAAFSTLLSEVMVFVFMVVGLKKSINLIDFKNAMSNLVKSIIASTSIVISSIVFLKLFGYTSVFYLLFTIIFSIILYILISIIIHNPSVNAFIPRKRKA